MADQHAPALARRPSSVLPAQASPCDALAIHAQPPSFEHPCRRKKLALAATILGSSMAFIDGSVVNVALPSIQTELGASVAAIQWVVNAYLLFLGSLVLVGGSLGDKLGRRTVFIAGIGLFTLASIGCGLAPGVGALIATRAAQGVGAALLVPSSLSIIGAVFDDKERGRAIGTWAGVGAITSAVGPVAGGWLVDAFSWRAIFFLNVPIACATLALAVIAVPDSRQEDNPSNPDPALAGHALPRLDWPGAVAAAAGLAALTYGLTRASAHGFGDRWVLASVLGGLLVLTGFVALEAKTRNPMMPLDVFRSRDFVGANLVTLLLYFGLGGALFFLPFTLIRAYGYSATEAGAALLPIPVTIGLLSRFTGGLTSRYGARALLGIGPGIAAIGFAMLALPWGTRRILGAFLSSACRARARHDDLPSHRLTTTVMTSGIRRAHGRRFRHQQRGCTRGEPAGDCGSRHRVRVVAPRGARRAARCAECAASGASGSAAGTSRYGSRRGAIRRHAKRCAGQEVTQAQAEALGAALRAVALVSALCALAGAALATLTIRSKKEP